MVKVIFMLVLFFILYKNRKKTDQFCLNFTIKLNCLAISTIFISVRTMDGILFIIGITTLVQSLRDF